MLFKSVIVLAFACVVRAAVIINVYEADGENKASHSLSGGCNYRACDQLCRRLGFTGGVCVGDKCKCDNFAPLTENKVEHSVGGGCNLRACEQLCRRLGFPGGVCIGDKCKCDNFEPITIKGTALDYLLKSGDKAKASHSVNDCNFQACDQLCRRLGFPGGACIGDKCNCDNFKEENEGDEYLIINDKMEKLNGEDTMYLMSYKDEYDAVTLPQDCDVFQCNDMCHRLHYGGGMCRNGSCECY